MIKKVILILSVFFSQFIYAGNNAHLDSLNRLYNNAKHDTTRANALLDIGSVLVLNQPDSALLVWNKALNLAERNISTSTGIIKTTFLRSKADAFINLGYVAEKKGKNIEALDYYTKSMQISKSINYFLSLAQSYAKIASQYEYIGDSKKAVENYYKALQMFEQLNYKKGIAQMYNNLGLFYTKQGETDNALNFYIKSLTILNDIKYTKGLAVCYNNIGNIYMRKKEHDKALEYFTLSFNLAQKINDKLNTALAIGNIGKLYESKTDYKQALEKYTESLKLYEEFGDKKNTALNCSRIANCYIHFDDYDKAYEYASRSYKIAQELNLLESISVSSATLAKIYTLKNEYKDAYSMMELHYKMRDSLSNDESKKLVVKRQLQYEFELKESNIRAEQEKLELLHQNEIKQNNFLFEIEKQKQKNKTDIELSELSFKEELKRKQLESEYTRKQSINELQQKAKDNIAKLESKKQKIVIASISISLVLISVFLIIVFNRFKVTKKQKNIIEKQKYEVEQQKELVEEKNKEILDSITYAKRLQEAILPPLKLVQKHLENSFILYKPKDIVAGDFYWFEPKDNLLLFAAADCTGHGVPGAMVSVVCSNALNRTVKEFGITEPGKILDKVLELVVETFEKSESEVKDGMDISLCALNLATNELFWSGANNPLWVVKKGLLNEYELDEYKADKQPIGKTESAISFSTQKIKLMQGQSFYVFTDGFADQFGGTNGKKYKSANFKKLLISIQGKTMQQQRQLIDEEFENWKGNLEQVDDVCVIGVRI